MSSAYAKWLASARANGTYKPREIDDRDRKEGAQYDKWQAARSGPGAHTMEVRSKPVGYDLYRAEKTLKGGVAPENFHYVADAVAARKAWFEQQIADNPTPLPPVDTRSPDGAVSTLLAAIGDSISSGAVSDGTVSAAQAIVSAFASDQVTESEANDALQAIDDILRAIRPYAAQPTKQGQLLISLQRALTRARGAAVLSIRLQAAPRASRVAILRDSLALPRGRPTAAALTVEPRPIPEAVNGRPRAPPDPINPVQVREEDTFQVPDPVLTEQERERLRGLHGIKAQLDEAERQERRGDTAGQRQKDKRAAAIAEKRRRAAANGDEMPEDDGGVDIDVDEGPAAAVEQAQTSAQAAFESAANAEMRDEHSAAHAEAATLAAAAARAAAERTVSNNHPAEAQAEAQRYATGAARAAIHAQQQAAEANMEHAAQRVEVPAGQEAATAAAITVVDYLAEELHEEDSRTTLRRMQAQRVQERARENVAAAFASRDGPLHTTDPLPGGVESRSGAPIDRAAATQRAIDAALFRGAPEAAAAEEAARVREANARVAVAAAEARVNNGATSRLWAEAAREQQQVILEEADEAGRIAAREQAARTAAHREAAGQPVPDVPAINISNAVHAAIDSAFAERTAGAVDEVVEVSDDEDDGDDRPRRKKRTKDSGLARKGDHGARKQVDAGASEALKKELRELAWKAAARARNDGASAPVAAVAAVEAVAPLAEAVGIAPAEVVPEVRAEPAHVAPEPAHAHVEPARDEHEAEAAAAAERASQRARKRAIDQVEIPAVQLRPEAAEPAAKRWREAREAAAAAAAEPAVAHVEPLAVPANAFSDAPAAPAHAPAKKASKKKAAAPVAAPPPAVNPFEAPAAAASNKAPKLPKKAAKPTGDKEAAEGRWTRARAKKEADRVAAVAEARAPHVPAAPLLLDPAHVAVGGLTSRADLHAAIEAGHVDEILAAMEAAGTPYHPHKGTSLSKVEKAIARKLGL